MKRLNCCVSGTASQVEHHCCSLEPSNVDTVGGLQSTGLTVSPPVGTFNTDTQCATPSSLGSCAKVDGVIGLCVCRMDELTLGRNLGSNEATELVKIELAQRKAGEEVLKN